MCLIKILSFLTKKERKFNLKRCYFYPKLVHVTEKVTCFLHPVIVLIKKTNNTYESVHV